MRISLAVAAFFLQASLAPSAVAGTAADHYFWRAASTDRAPRPYAVLLPGSSGLSILGDDTHYFKAADWLNAQGVDALVVDYQKAVKYVPAAKKGEAGPRMALIVEDALKTMRAQGHAGARCPAAVIGWSLGAEGAWAAAARNDLARAVAVYYPTVRAAGPYRNVVPVLALQGGADDVTPAAQLKAFVAARAPDSAPLSVRVFDGAVHGFDVASIKTPRVLRFPPLVGQKATFGYDAAAAKAARADLERFLRAEGVIGGACG